MPPDGSDGGPNPSAVTYAKGTATVTIGTTATKLDHVIAPGPSYAGMGTEVTWTDDHGIYLRFFGSSLPGEPDMTNVMIDRIHDGSHWTTFDPTGCKVTLTQSDNRALVGSATCTAMRWSDVMAAETATGPGIVAGEPPFDASVTFRATP